MDEDDWRNWKDGRYDNRYHGVRRHSGKRYHGRGKSKAFSIVIFTVVLSIAVLYVLINGIPQISIPNFIETRPPSQTTTDTSQGQTKPTTSDNSLVLSNCLMASNGVGGIRINCADHDSVQCTSDPPIGAGIYKDATLTIDKNSCIVQYPNSQGTNTIYHFQLGTSPITTNTRSNPSTTPPATITLPKVTFPNVTFPKVTLPTIPSPEISNPVDTKPVIDIPILESKIHTLINVQRTQNGLIALFSDPQLNLIARAHSQDMATRNYFEHVTPEGADPTERGLSAGYHCHKDLPNGYYADGLAENIFKNNLKIGTWGSLSTTNVDVFTGNGPSRFTPAARQMR